MKKIFLVALIIYSAAFLSACQLIQNLIVVNSSDEEIELQYELKTPTNFQPEVTSESNFNNWRLFQKGLDKIPAQQITAVEKTNIIIGVTQLNQKMQKHARSKCVIRRITHLLRACFCKNHINCVTPKSMSE